MAHIREEGELLSGTIDFPETRTIFRDRHALIVVRGTDHVKDLRALRAYIRDVRPVLIGVDGGADAILKEGLTARHRPRRHGLGQRGDAPLRRRADRPRLSRRAAPRAPSGCASSASTTRSCPPPAPARTSRCCSPPRRAPSLIVSVGAHFNLVEFLDKQRSGMSSTFLTRLRIGETLVDAKGVSRLYNPGLELAQWPSSSACSRRCC